MFSAFFGNYLLNKGVVSKEELSKVLDKQKTIRLKLGVLAINGGLMTSQQVDEVNALQISQDRRFGEIALSKGYLNDEQLIELLGQQKAEHLLLAQALIDDGFMTMASFEEEIGLYKIETGLDDQQFEAIKNGNVDIIVTAFCAFEKSTMSSFYIDFVTLFVKNIIRFVDTNVHIERVERIDAITYPHLFKQNLKGEDTIFTAYSGDDKALINIASKHAEEDFNDLSEYPLDSANEFLNLTNGLFVVNMSNQGVEIDLTVQEYIHGASIYPKGKMYRIPIHITSGIIYLMIGHL